MQYSMYFSILGFFLISCRLVMMLVDVCEFFVVILPLDTNYLNSNSLSKTISSSLKDNLHRVLTYILYISQYL